MKRIFTAVILLAISLLSSCADQHEKIKLHYKNITEMVFASGALEADHQYNLTAQTDGYINEMTFKEGDNVKKGQVMAVIDNDQNLINAQSAAALGLLADQNALLEAPVLQEIKAGIEAAEVKVKLDEQQLERYRRLYENNSISRTEFENADLAVINSHSHLKSLKERYKNQQLAAKEKQLIQLNASRISRILKEQNKIVNTQTGRVYEKKKQLGDYVRKGDVIAVIGNPNIMYARLNVDETNIAKLKKGQTVIMSLNTGNDRQYRGSIKEILPAFDNSTRSFIVKAYFDKTPDFTITGTKLQANIIIGTKKNVLAIPIEFLSYGNKVLLENKKEVTVTPGIISNEWVEIKDGLQAGQTIIREQQ